MCDLCDTVQSYVFKDSGIWVCVPCDWEYPKIKEEQMGRATEFIDFLTSDNVDDITYSHLEIRDEDGKILKKYLKIRSEFLKEKRRKKKEK